MAKRTMTKADANRIISAGAKTKGPTQKDSFEARAQSTADKNAQKDK